MLVSKRKRYLSGSDWGINALDSMMKDATCSGNMSQIVLMLNSSLNACEVRECLNRFIRQFPVVQGRVARDYKLTPYWKIPALTKRDVTLCVSQLDDVSLSGRLFEALTRSANSEFRDNNDHVAFHLFTDRTRSVLAMTFDHRLFDARGAEAFLNLFQQSLQNGQVSGDIDFTSSQELTHWKEKFLAGRNVNRRIIALAKSPAESLPVPRDRKNGFQYRLLSFSEQETAAIYDKAYTEAGYLLESPFFLSVITNTLHELFQGKPATGSSYLIPVTMDLRPGLEPLQEVFFNHVSYLFYQIPMQEAGDMKQLIAAFKQQMYDQVKAGFPQDLAEASLLTRIVPPCLLGKVLQFPLKGRMATFAFAHLGRSSYQSPEFMQSGIDAVFHMPRVPVPPGLGFFSNYFNKKLNLVISHLEGLLTNEEVNMIESGIRRRFGTSRS